MSLPAKPIECEPLTTTPGFREGQDARLVIGRYIAALDQRDARASVCNAWANAVLAAYGDGGSR